MERADLTTGKLRLYDTTLRDGAQGEDVTFSVEDKLRIAARLDAMGFDYIEGGWPGSNPRDVEFFRRAADIDFRHARLAAFGSTRRAKSDVREDQNIRALLDAGTPVVTIFGKTSMMHVRSALQTTPDENLAMIADSVRFLVESGREVVYDAEHFFDGAAEDERYALKTLEAAAAAGASTLVLCDTNGGTMTEEIVRLVRIVRAAFSAPVGIHTHNDCELAVANALAAIRAGASHVQGTINGYGERCGNANLCSIIPNLQLKLGIPCLPDDRLPLLTDLSRMVSELSNQAPRKYLAYVGESAFAHKGGVHVNAVMKLPSTYEHIQPEQVGNRRRVLVSDLSGRSNVMYKARELGIAMNGQGEDLREILDIVKAREHRGYSYENADGSLELLIREQIGEWTEFFRLEGLKLIILKESPEGEPTSEALIKVRVGNLVEHTAAEGNGPVNALDNALRKALDRFYPQLRETYLSDYKVRVLEGSDGTAANVRVMITTRHGQESWNTVGVSTNIIEASWKALVDGVYYHLNRTVTTGKEGEPHGIERSVV